MAAAEPTTTARPIHRAGGEGDGIWAMASLFEMKLRSSESAGELSVMEVTQQAGVATPLHVHGRESEAFYVLDGSLTYEGGGELFHLASGSFIYLPKGVPHRFRITGTSPARFLGLILPGGLEALYEGVGGPAAERRVPDWPSPDQMRSEIQRWNELGPRHGLRVVGPPLPE